MRTDAGIGSKSITIPQPDNETFEYYTAEELKKAIHDQEISLRDMDLERRKMELQYTVKQNELADLTIKSYVKGRVGAFQDLEDIDYSKPLTVIDGGEGYYLNGTVSELYLDLFEPGSVLDCTGYGENGMVSCQATVTEVSDYPTDKNDYYGDGNPNVSYYPFTAYIEDGTGLTNGMYMDISISIAGNTDTFYLDKMYIRQEDNKNYVWAANPETGLLEKRYVRLGKTLYDSYYEIKGGLTQDDLIAVPFGKNLKPGVKTHNTMDDDGNNNNGIDDGGIDDAGDIEDGTAEASAALFQE